MKLKHLIKTITVVALAVSLSGSLAGCGANASGNQTGESQQTVGQSVADDGTQATGRYVEQVVDASQLEGAKRICQLEDGTLMCLSPIYGVFISEDQGQTWEQQEAAWFERLVEEGNYIQSMAAAPDGSIAVMYAPLMEDAQMMYDMNFQYMFVTADGEEKAIELPLADEEMWASAFYFSGDNRLFIPVMGGNTIYEVDGETGGATAYLTTPENIGQISFLQDKMILSGEGTYIYNMTDQAFVEDLVLTDFIRQNYGMAEYGEAGFNCYIFTDDEDCIYVAGHKGLYRHVFGGSVMEQVVDGNLSTYGKPSVGIADAIMQQKTDSQYPEFMVLFGENFMDTKLMHYVYDEQIPTVPDESLTVYSLVENETVKQAIAMYQAENPQLFIQYQVGSDGENGITKEDALRNLTTQLMSGSGPDILVLDEMPYKTYQSKGILADLSDVIAGRESEYFYNLFAPYQEGEALYALPCEVKLPFVAGKEEYVNQITGLDSIADCLEEIEKQYSGQSQLSIYTASDLMKLFAMLSESRWTGEDGQLQEQELENFLTQMKRIYEIQMRNAKDEDIALYMENMAYGENDPDSLYWQIMDYLDVVADYRQIQFGALGSTYDYQSCLSGAKGGESDVVMKAMPERDQKPYLPYTIVGVNAASTNLESAKDFAAFMLGTQVQTSLLKGFSVNREALEECFAVDAEWKDGEGVISVVAVMYDDGTTYELPIYEATGEEKQALVTQLEEADTPFLRDDVLETAVIEEGSAYLEGTIDLATAMAEIRDRVQLYLSE